MRSGWKQEYNFFTAGRPLLTSAASFEWIPGAAMKPLPEGEEDEHESTRTFLGARGYLGRHGDFHERVQPA
jgi:hypothetical protein